MTLLENIAYLARRGDAAAIDRLLGEEVLALTGERAEDILLGRTRCDRETGREARLPQLDHDQIAALGSMGYIHKPTTYTTKVRDSRSKRRRR